MNKVQLRMFTAIKEYICRKSSYKLEPSASLEEIKDYLQFLEMRRQYNIFDWDKDNFEKSIKDCLSSQYNYVADNETNKPLLVLNNNTIEATYNLIHLIWINQQLDMSIDRYLSSRDFKRGKEVNNKFINYYNQIFCENTAALLVQNLFETIIKKDYISKGMWPVQCADIYEYLLNIDLSKIIGLPSLQDRLLDFYQSAKEKMNILVGCSDHIILSNDKSWILARNNMDFVTSSTYINNDNDKYYLGDFFHDPLISIINIDKNMENYEIRNNLWCPYKQESGNIMDDELTKLSRTLNQKIK